MNRQRSGRPSAPRLLGASALHRTILLPILLILLSLPVTGPSLAADLHAVVVIDTGDQNIGTMVHKDMNLMDRELAQIASLTGMTLRKTVLEGANFKLNRITGAIEGLSVSRNDVIVFYYSGHGFRTQNKQYKWPYFWFHNNEPLDFAWVIQALQAKGARLVLALTDACNNVVNVQVREEQKGIGATADKAVNGYKELFLRYKGWVAGASSIPGETSTATGSGSLFTISFLSALRHQIAQPTPDWKPLMDSAAGQRLTHRGSNGKVYSQQPFYKMNASRIAVAANPPATQPPATQPPATQPPAVTPPQPPAPTVQYPTAGTQPPAPPPPVTPPPAVQPPPQQPSGFPQGQWVPIN